MQNYCIALPKVLLCVVPSCMLPGLGTFGKHRSADILSCDRAPASSCQDQRFVGGLLLGSNLFTIMQQPLNEASLMAIVCVQSDEKGHEKPSIPARPASGIYQVKGHI